MMAGKVVGLEFEIMYKLGSFFFNDSTNNTSIDFGFDIGKTCDFYHSIKSISGRCLESASEKGILGKCKNFLCPYETRIREYHPTVLQAKLRAKALDPYGFMIMDNQTRYVYL